MRLPTSGVNVKYSVVCGIFGSESRFIETYLSRSSALDLLFLLGAAEN